jgi:SAM-dependent methyltransferase
MHLVYRKTCRVCGSATLRRVISLGEQNLQGSFLKPGKEVPPLRKIETTLVRCDPTQDESACGLLQMASSVPPEILYSAYWYRSGTNATMRNHLGGIVEDVVAKFGATPRQVLDIGCNDGTLLKAYDPNVRRFGVDPSDVAREVGEGIEVVQDIFPSAELTARMDGSKFDVITSIAMFYDLEDPIRFSTAIRDALAPEGIWCFEMSYMPTMLTMGSYDTICHEHLEYYSLAVIEYILRAANLKLFAVSLNGINGGSIRCYATHAACYKYKNPRWADEIRALRQSEFDLELDTDKPYRNFQERMERHRDELNALLRDLKRGGKRIHIYGASTKGNTILQWCGIDSRIIDFAAERNPDKYGALTIGTEIPIISEAESREMKPDYYLVLPWHFRDEFVERERATVESGSALIFPLPTVEVLRASDLGARKLDVVLQPVGI